MTADRFTSLTLVFASLLALGACSERGGVGAGPVRSEAREVGSFDAIDLEGAAKIEVRVGEPASLVIEGREREIERVQTDVRDGTLYINNKRRHWIIVGGRERITLKIALPQLRSLKLEGGNDVSLSGFDGGDSDIAITGAGHITAEGRLDELSVHMAGAGRADLGRLVARAAKVTVDGVGSVTVNPTDSLDATMNGIGAIYYTGNPRNVSTRMHGLGTISRRDGKDSGEEDEAGADQPDAPQRDPPAKDETTIVI